ncbi:MAG: hypothetical protein WCF20_11685 [Methylovirgula sp.]
MKYALFALGLLLLLIGGYSVYFGAGIIEVERGWASVIAGTTAVVGGVLTLGLAWILKTLDQLRALLQANEMKAAVKSTPPPAHEVLHGARETFVPAMDLPIAPVAWPPHTSPLHAPIAQQDALAEPPLADTETELAADSFEENAYSAFGAEANEATRAPAHEPAPTAERVKPSPSVRDLWRRVANEIDTPPSSARPAMQKGAYAVEPPLVPPPLSKAATASETVQPSADDREAEPSAETGDWLDHALADLDLAMAQAPFAQLSDASADIEPHKNMPTEAAALAAEPAQGELPADTEEPAIIGRYEAEGTSYIMFADGSIEAQSERGVARFKSMADLKAYFETQEAPQ